MNLVLQFIRKNVKNRANVREIGKCQILQLLEIPGLFVTETALPMIDEFIFIRTSRLNGFFGTNFLTIKEYYYYSLEIVTSLEKLVFVFGIVTYHLLNKIKLKMN